MHSNRERSRERRHQKYDGQTDRKNPPENMNKSGPMQEFRGGFFYLGLFSFLEFYFILF